ncbi:MAG: cell division protein ZapB [Treponema sp.]|nr:cell division protein ZapB [Treponema sp.]MDY3721333.1 cell division protein ZapB [Treponema sp.]MDY5757128.1 cell division protein ZapB [Treponema sp.]
MISLDQVYLLEQKVESAVEKIQQLQAENDALRSKCNELTNALSAKSEQLSNFESDQSQIETGIKKALDRLNSIENSVLKNADQQNQAAQAAKPEVQVSPAPQEQSATTVQSTPSFDTMDTVPETTEEPTEVNEEQSVNIPEQTFYTTNIEENFESEDDIDAPEDDNHDGLGFDIF